jgi:hypothetical protein
MHETAWGKSVDRGDRYAVEWRSEWRIILLAPAQLAWGTAAWTPDASGEIRMNSPRAATKRKTRGRGEGGGMVGHLTMALLQHLRTETIEGRNGASHIPSSLLADLYVVQT